MLTLLAAGGISLLRWLPELELELPYSLLMAGRTEFGVMAFVASVLLTIPLTQLTKKNQKKLGSFFLVFVTLYFCMLPFAAPIFLYKYHARFE